MSSKNVGRGNFAEDYEITIELAKLITLNSRSIVKQRYAQWLLELERKLNNLEILTVEQAIFIQKLIELFRFISNQKQAVWDYLHTKNRPDVALKVAEMTYIIAKESGVKLFVTNETNLF